MAAIDASVYEKFIVESTDGNRTVDIRQGVVAFVYYENILAPSLTATAIVVNTGGTIAGKDGKTLKTFVLNGEAISLLKEL